MNGLFNQQVLYYFLDNKGIDISKENIEMILILAEKQGLNKEVLGFVLKREKVSQMEVEIIHQLAKDNSLKNSHMAYYLAKIIQNHCDKESNRTTATYDDMVRVLAAITSADPINIDLLVWQLIRRLTDSQDELSVSPLYLKGLTLGLFAIQNFYDEQRYDMSEIKFCQEFKNNLCEIIFYQPKENYQERDFVDKMYENKLSQAIKSFVKRGGGQFKDNQKVLTFDIFKATANKYEGIALNLNSQMIINQLAYADFGTFSALGKIECLISYYKVLSNSIPH